MDRRIGIGLLIAGLLVTALLTVAGRLGRGRVYALDAGGTLGITNDQANAVWKPATVTIVCSNAAERTVAVTRTIDGVVYEISSVTDTGRVFIYEFTANYWFALSNVLSVTVDPATTGVVEVIRE